MVPSERMDSQMILGSKIIIREFFMGLCLENIILWDDDDDDDDDEIVMGYTIWQTKRSTENPSCKSVPSGKHNS